VLSTYIDNRVQQHKGLTGIDSVPVLTTCVIQRPQSGIQRETSNDTLSDETVIEIEMAGLDTEYAALVAEFSLIAA
jgi:hypothetical protein